MRTRSKLGALIAIAAASFVAPAYAANSGEDFQKDNIPPGAQVINNALEGPVFTTAEGRTLYRWPKKSLRNGNTGEIQGKPACDDTVYRVNSGLMSPYPGGFILPDADTRVSCVAMYPPFLAPADAKPMGKWSIVDRADGRKQWAYDDWPLYTYALDKLPGEAMGGSNLDNSTETGAGRIPIGPDANIPSQFEVSTTMRGRLVTLKEGWSVYTYEKDGRNKSNCKDDCLDGWQPVLAAAYARPVGDWTLFERSPGVKQWAFRGAPLYRYLTDRKQHGMDGSDNPGWHNVYTQMSPTPPKEFAPKDTMIGVVLGDANGKTIYRYRCTDDAVDQQLCDFPEAPQAYRLAVCGGGDVDHCLKAFPYVLVARGAKSGNTTWTTLYIDPRTGKRAAEGDAGALHVWAYRGRPVYTFAGDKRPADILAHDWGEFNGLRNGYMAIVFRDVFARRDE